jgi:hypothetical protein
VILVDIIPGLYREGFQDLVGPNFIQLCYLDDELMGESPILTHGVIDGPRALRNQFSVVPGLKHVDYSCILVLFTQDAGKVIAFPFSLFWPWSRPKRIDTTRKRSELVVTVRVVN